MSQTEVVVSNEINIECYVHFLQVFEIITMT
jgi:hypothetical protein